AGGNNGNILIDAGATASTTSISTGPIDTTGGLNGTGQIVLAAAKPTLTGNNTTSPFNCVNCVTIDATTGAITSTATPVTTATSQSSSISVNGTLTGSAALISLSTNLDAIINGPATAISNSATTTGVLGNIQIDSGRDTIITGNINNSAPN